MGCRATWSPVLGLEPAKSPATYGFGCVPLEDLLNGFDTLGIRAQTQLVRRVTCWEVAFSGESLSR